MLKLIDIKKDYVAGDNVVHALKGVSLEFREHEFVAVLGQSGCGKTTLLNIIGGLDQYTSGDLVINGKSTKDYEDSDWDTYRNHSIGFVFQTYNLIPHQTVLSNVELALTLSGVDKAERRRRAVEALESVGLGDQIYKKPNQMSGGQMQRVAIARALVNNPDIILADEPTGALDSETSLQIMDILKEISKDKLIIMVTHNPELADEYASRIIRLKDGLITSDSQPYDESSEIIDKTVAKKPSMSFWTALSLSVNNLLTKKARTILTAFAGSIGIIGIALIMSLSSGIQNYIDKVQGDTLSSYPITIEAETMDMTSMMTSLMGVQTDMEENQHEKDRIYSNTILYDLINNLQNADTQQNNLVAFKKYLDDPESEINQYISSVKYSYDIAINFYCKDVDGNIVKTDITEIIQNAMGETFGGDYSSYFNTFGSYYTIADAWQELLSGENGELINPLLKEQYDLIYGQWPENFNEAVLVVSENNEVSDLVLYALGLKSNSSLSEDMESFINLDNLKTDIESWSYEEICNLEFRYIYPSDEFEWNEDDQKYEKPGEIEDLQLENLFNKGLPVKITGIIRQNEDAVSGMMSTGAIGYTHSLVEYVVNHAAGTELVKKQLADEKNDALCNLPYLEGDEKLTNSIKVQAVKDYIDNATEAELADVYIEFMTVPEESYIDEKLDEQLEDTTREDIEDMILKNYPEYSSFIKDMDDDTLFDYVRQTMTTTIEDQYASQMRDKYSKLNDSVLCEDFKLLNLDEDDYLWMYDHAIPPVYSDSSCEDVLLSLGYVDLNNPSSVNIYASTFEDKDSIADCIERYNDTVGEDDEIEYTDIVAVLMSSVSTILNVISYVLIAFVSISLVVSSIMIGIITYISVLERTKEIGILRAIGASKKDVSRVFNAETFIIGLFAGLIGVLLTVLLNIPISIIVRDLTNIQYLTSSLPVAGGVFLVFISVFLTYIAGLIPSGLAAKKDPVEALRTE